MAYPGFQRGGCLRSGPIRKVGGGGGSPLQVRYTKSVWGAIRLRSDTKSGGGASPLQVRYAKSGGGGGGGGNSLQVRYEKWGGGSPDPIYEKWGWGGGGGGGPFRFRSDTFVWHTENIYMYLPTCYQGMLHTRANERKIHAAKG